MAVEETVFEPLAARYAAVLPEERREGIALVDIGAQSTDLVVYYGESLQLASSLPICGDHFTRDVAPGFHISYEDARAGRRKNTAAPPRSSRRRTARRGAVAGDRDARELPRRLLNEILEARAEELFDYRAARAGARGHGAGAGGRRGADRRRRAADRHVRYGRERAEVPGAERSARRDSRTGRRNSTIRSGPRRPAWRCTRRS